MGRPGITAEGGGGRGGGSRPRPSWPAKGITFDVSFQWIRIHFHQDEGGLGEMGDVTAQTWSPSVGWLLHNNHESQSNWEQLRLVKNISGAGKEIYLVCVCVCVGGTAHHS